MPFITEPPPTSLKEIVNNECSFGVEPKRTAVSPGKVYFFSVGMRPSRGIDIDFKDRSLSVGVHILVFLTGEEEWHKLYAMFIKSQRMTEINDGVVVFRER